VRDGSTKDGVLEKLKNTEVKFLTNNTPPFNVFPLGEYLEPKRPMQSFGTCAVVSSAGFLRGRKLGAFIGEHLASK
jgi:hypothetical protein